jgi:methyl-accepting chemotaxis protein
MIKSPLALARRVDRRFGAACALLLLVAIGAGHAAGASWPVLVGAAAAGLVVAGIAWRHSGRPVAAYALALATTAAAFGVALALPDHPLMLMLVPVVLSLLPPYRSPGIVVACGGLSVVVPWLPGVPLGAAEAAVFSGIVIVQSALLMEFARHNGRQIKRLFDVDFLLRAMDSPEGIRLDLGVVRPETEFGRKLHDIQNRMGGTLQQLARSAEATGSAAHALQASGSELTARTQNACTELAGAASTLQQIAVIVKASADAALAARETAEGASALARDGSGIVHEMVGQMKVIEQSSRRIQEITGLIESIAFQTNLLALNAAVEAARAGDQGRGFAVVAAEVRLLAQRVAKAAAEVRTLTDGSAEAVVQGTRMAGRAGTTMDQLTTAVTQVIEEFRHLSADTSEHAAGIDSMSAAMLELNAATQRNLDVANESRRIADELASHTAGVAHAMSAFRLGGAPAMRTPPAVPPPTDETSGRRATASPAPPAPPAAAQAADTSVVEYF